MDLDSAGTAACRDLVEALPDTVNGLEAVEVGPDDALGAAWGDPPIVVTCGAAEPEDFDEVTWVCQEVQGVGWFASPDLLEADRQDEDITVWAMTHEPLVSLRIPADYRPDDVAGVLGEVAEPIAAHLELEEPCLAPPSG